MSWGISEVLGIVGTVTGWGAAVYNSVKKRRAEKRLQDIDRRRLAPFLWLKMFIVKGVAFEVMDPDPSVEAGAECRLMVVNSGMSAVDVTIDGPEECDWKVQFEEGPFVLPEGTRINFYYPKQNDLDGKPIRFKIKFEVEGVRGEHTYEHRHYRFDLRRVDPPIEAEGYRGPGSRWELNFKSASRRS